MKKLGVSLAMLAFLSGCASIVEGSSQKINVSTNPPANVICNAKNSRGDWKADPVPGAINIKRSKSELTIDCSGDGYTGQITNSSDLESWAAGNLVFGGLIGIAIDAGTGALFSYDDAIMVPVKLKDPYAHNLAPTGDSPIVPPVTTTVTTTTTTAAPAEATAQAPAAPVATTTTTVTPTTVTTVTPTTVVPAPASAAAPASGEPLSYEELVARGVIVTSSAPAKPPVVPESH